MALTMVNNGFDHGHQSATQWWVCMMFDDAQLIDGQSMKLGHDPHHVIPVPCPPRLDYSAWHWGIERSGAPAWGLAKSSRAIEDHSGLKGCSHDRDHDRLRIMQWITMRITYVILLWEIESFISRSQYIGNYDEVGDNMFVLRDHKSQFQPWRSYRHCTNCTSSNF